MAEPLYGQVMVASVSAGRRLAWARVPALAQDPAPPHAVKAAGAEQEVGGRLQEKAGGGPARD